MTGIIQSISDLLNSNFTAALAGAFAGAWAAQKIGDRTKTKDDLRKEILNTNAAIMISGNICNAFAGLKSQHLIGMKRAYDEQCQRARKQDANGDPFHGFKGDLQTLVVMTVPIERLNTLIFEKLSLNGRPLGLAGTLIHSINSCNQAVERRNQIIQHCREKYDHPSDELVRLYVGLRLENGTVDEVYPHIMDHIYTYADDVIQFSMTLCEDLTKHGRVCEARLRKQFRDNSTSVNSVDFSDARNKGLLPDEADYADWTSMFVEREKEKTLSVMQRIRDYIGV